MGESRNTPEKSEGRREQEIPDAKGRLHDSANVNEELRAIQP